MSDYEIINATTREDIAAIRALFMEYQEYLDINLDFQNFGEELAELPGKYAPPAGRLLLARCQGKAVGCVGFYPLTEDICELKRLYVHRGYANKGIGRALFETALSEAKAVGYRVMRLDSMHRLKEAEKLYRLYGFRDIAPYNDSPHADAYHMERDL